MTNQEVNQVADAVVRKLQELGVVPRVKREEYIGAKDAAVILNMSVRTLYKKLDEIPHVKRGKCHVFAKDSLYEYMQR